MGKQLAASITTLICYYALGLPFAIYLGLYKGLELYGFWMGFAFTVVLLDVIVATIVVKADWSLESLQAQEKEIEENEADPLTKSLKVVSRRSS